MRKSAALLFILLVVAACETQRPTTELSSPSEPESTEPTVVALTPTASPTETPTAPLEPTPTSTPDSTPAVSPQPPVTPSPIAAVMWNGLVVEAENRCSPLRL